MIDNAERLASPEWKHLPPDEKARAMAADPSLLKAYKASRARGIKEALVAVTVGSPEWKAMSIMERTDAIEGDPAIKAAFQADFHKRQPHRVQTVSNVVYRT